MGLLDDLGGYLSSIGSSPVQAINPNTAPGQAAALPPAAGAPSATGMPTSINGIPVPKQTLLDNPYLQGILGAYFNTISTPKSAGLGGAIGRGGLGGLGAYEAARRAQYTPYLTAAQLATAQANAQKANVQANQLYPAQAELAKKRGSLLDVQAANEPLKGKELQAKTDLEQAQLPGIQAKTALTEQQKETEKGKLGVQQSEEAAHYSEVGKNQAAAALDVTRKDLLPQQVKNQTNMALAAVQKATDPQRHLAAVSSLRKTLGAEYDASIGVMARNAPKFLGGKSTEELQQGKEQYISTRMVEMGVTETGAGLAPPSVGGGGELPALPANAKEYAVGPDGHTVGYHDASGTFHAF